MTISDDAQVTIVADTGPQIALAKIQRRLDGRSGRSSGRTTFGPTCYWPRWFAPNSRIFAEGTAIDGLRGILDENLGPRDHPWVGRVVTARHA